MKILYVVLFVATAILFVGCKTDKFITDVNGNVYKLVSEGKVIDDAQVEVPTWERISPKDTNHWYYPPLQAKSNTNAPLMMFSRPRD